MIWLLWLLLSQADPDQTRFQEAQQLAAAGRCAEAEPVLKSLAEAHPRVGAIGFTLGQCQFASKDYMTAATSLRRALELDPQMVEARSLYGAALGLSGHTAEAVEQLRQAIRTDGAFEPSLRLLGMFEVENGQTGVEARTSLEKAIQLDGSDARAHYWMGQLLLLNKNYEDAEREFAASLKLQPLSTQAQLGHAKALMGTGMADDALIEYQAVLKAEPESTAAQLGVATCLYDQQQFEQALIEARAAEQRVTDSQDRRAALWLLSRLYRVLGDQKKAEDSEHSLAALEQSKNGDLTRFRALQEQAMRFRAARDYAKVATTLEAALRIEHRQDSLVMLGDAYEALARPRDAEKCYVEALAAGPEQQEISRRLEDVRSRLRSEASR